MHFFKLWILVSEITFTYLFYLLALSKVTEKSIHNQTNDYLQMHGLLYIYQSGFRVNHSTDIFVLVNGHDFKWCWKCKTYWYSLGNRKIRKKIQVSQKKCICFCLKLNSRQPTKERVEQCITTNVFKYWKETSPFYVKADANQSTISSNIFSACLMKCWMKNYIFRMTNFLACTHSSNIPLNIWTFIQS